MFVVATADIAQVRAVDLATADGKDFAVTAILEACNFLESGIYCLRTARDISLRAQI